MNNNRVGCFFRGMGESMLRHWEEGWEKGDKRDELKNESSPDRLGKIMA